MALLCKSSRLLFIMSPGTACTAVGDVLKKELEGEYLPADHITDEQGRIVVGRKHCTLRELTRHKIIDPAAVANLITFTTVRNPFDRLVSAYVKKRNSEREMLENPKSYVHQLPGFTEDIQFCSNHSFDEWIKAKYQRGLLKTLLGRGRRSLSAPYADGANFVMKFEQLQQDFETVLKMAGVPNTLQVQTINVTSAKANHYRDYYSPKPERSWRTFFAMNSASTTTPSEATRGPGTRRCGSEISGGLEIAPCLRVGI